MNIKSVLAKELKKISLSSKKILEMNDIAKNFISSLESKGIKAFLGGSLAKGTLIKKDIQDIDIFVVFEKEEETKKLEEIIKKSRIKGELKKVHGSRDYFQILKKENNVILEIIPVVKNKNPEQAENVTDVSLSHVKYIKSKINKNKKLADEIKLAKAFCFAQNCYGAESYIQGFSGYSLEVLISYFGEFIKFLKKIPKKTIIDPEKHFKNDKEIKQELNESKIQGPLILIDPTYKYRNIAAGLNQETFEKFLIAAKQFLKNPSEKFFEKKEINPEELKNFARKNKAKFFEIHFKTNKQEGDIAGTKMKKFFNFLISELERKEQKAIKKEFFYSGKGNTAKGYLIIKIKQEIEVKGPENYMRDAVKRFKKSRKKVYERGKFFYCKEKIDLEKIFYYVKTFEEDMGVEIVKIK